MHVTSEQTRKRERKSGKMHCVTISTFLLLRDDARRKKEREWGKNFFLLE